MWGPASFRFPRLPPPARGLSSQPKEVGSSRPGDPGSGKMRAVGTKGMDSGRERAVALALGVAVVVIWGLSFVATRVAVQGIPPLTLAFVRFLLASLLLVPLVRRRHGRVRLGAKDRWLVVAMGLTGVTLAFVFENVGLRYTTASHGALLVSLTPLASAVSEAALGRTRLRWRTVAGLLGGLAGVALIVGSPFESGGSLLGDGLMLATVVCWVVYSFITERLTGSLPNLLVTTRAIVAGTVALAPLAMVELAFEGLRPPTPGEWVAVVYLAVFCSALAYVWWNRTLSVVGVAVNNSLIYGIQMVGVSAGVALLGEPMSARVLVGGVLVVGGVVLATLRGKAEAVPRG